MNIKLIAVISLLLHSVSLYALEAKDLNFEYVPADGASYACTHEQIENLPYDWTVRCPFMAKTKEFSVHLLITNYPSSKVPMDRYEIIYWVTNRIPGAKVPEFTGSTIWFNFVKETMPHSLRLTQHVDNSFANLSLDVKL